MKIFAILATAILATAIYAAPAIVEARNIVSIPVSFIGAAGGSFTKYFPIDDSLQIIFSPLSVSQIRVPQGFTCIFYGIDGSVVKVVGPITVDVGPPQVIVEGKCHPT